MKNQTPTALGCAAVRALLPGLDGREIEPSRVFEVRRHLATCAECSAEAASYRSMRKVLGDLHAVPLPPPPGLLGDLLQAAAAPGVIERAAAIGRGAVGGSRPRVVAAGVGVGAMAAGGIGLLAWRVLRSRRLAA